MDSSADAGPIAPIGVVFAGLRATPRGYSERRPASRLCSFCARTIGNHRSQSAQVATIRLAHRGQVWPIVANGAL